jgi:DtxR family transcriptional regulator, Mn-dependent transcriptional regulator
MSPAPLSRTAEDYLKAIYKLQNERGRATTSALATRVGVSPPSATSMLKKLAALKLVRHERYRGVTLTTAGEKAAIEIIRHHRLLEQYLSESLGMPIDEVHAEADRLEHALSEELEARIDKSLGYPTHDPHGDPIPDAELQLKPSELRPLSGLTPGEGSTIRRVPDDKGLLAYLRGLGLLPGANVHLVQVAPFAGPVTILVDRAEHAISRELADQIGVETTHESTRRV